MLRKAFPKGDNYFKNAERTRPDNFRLPWFQQMIRVPRCPPQPITFTQDVNAGVLHFNEVLDSVLNINLGRGGGGARCSSVIDPSWGGPIELFLVPARAPRLV